MFIANIKRIVDQVSQDKGIDREILIKALEEALKYAAKKKYGDQIDIEIQYDSEQGEIEAFQFKEVAEVIEDPNLQITLEEGRKLDSECQIGDSLGLKMDTATFGRIAAQSAKQVIIQKIKDAERDAIYSNFVDRKGEIINGIVQNISRGDVIVNLGYAEAILPAKEQVPRETFHRGDRIRALILDILHDSKGPQIVLTRKHKNFLIALFKTEVPEISEGIVKVQDASREAGIRSKFAVSSEDSDIDPVGACVGMKGSRVQNVVQELRGEKIDIVPWHVDPAKFVCNALAPAEILRVIIDDSNHIMEVIVPDEFLSVAIGKRGQNVRLASKLTGWNLDVKGEASYNKIMEDGYNSLTSLPEMSVGLADALYENGLFSIEELSSTSVSDLITIRDIDEEKALELIESAKDALEKKDKVEDQNKEAEDLNEADDPQEETEDLNKEAENINEADDPQEETEDLNEEAKDLNEADDPQEETEDLNEETEDLNEEAGDLNEADDPQEEIKDQKEEH